MTLKLLKTFKTLPFPPRWPPSTCFFTLTALPFKCYMHNKATRPRGWTLANIILPQTSTFFNRFIVASQQRPNLDPGSSRFPIMIAVKHAFLPADFNHNCARIPNTFAQKVYTIKDVINFSRLRG